MLCQQKAPDNAGAETEPSGSDPIDEEELGFLSFLFLTLGHERDAFLLGQLDLKLITRNKIQQRGVRLAHQEIAIALDDSFVGELAAAFADATTRTNPNALGF